MYKRMLVPLDGSKLSEVVFPYAKELAVRLDLEVILFHVHSSEKYEATHLYRAYIEHKVDIIKRQAEEVQQKTITEPKGKAVQVRGELTVGHPAEEILRYADENDIDLILMATHGRSGIRRWVMGSVADKVLRASKTPIWLVRSGVPDEIVYDKWPKKTILVPLDGSKLAEAVLPHVEALAKQRGAELVDVVLLRVCEPPVMPPYYSPSARFKTSTGVIHVTPQEYIQAAIAGCKAEAKRYLAGVEKRLKEAELRVQSEVLEGESAAKLIEYAKMNPFNLIVMSTHARSGLSRWAYGSIANKALQGVTSPIFLVRPSQA